MKGANEMSTTNESLIGELRDGVDRLQVDFGPLGIEEIYATGRARRNRRRGFAAVAVAGICLTSLALSAGVLSGDVADPVGVAQQEVPAEDGDAARCAVDDTAGQRFLLEETPAYRTIAAAVHAEKLGTGYDVRVDSGNKVNGATASAVDESGRAVAVFDLIHNGRGWLILSAAPCAPAR